ncbi:MAG TPA: beta-ketoacyl-ACP synthase III [Gaiellaceae bacterium]|nr:beta-ketoacyl-ACP synthase III [Gaiellaceae bacterium]
MIANVSGNGIAVGITGIGAYAPERVLTNADLERMVDTSDEWIETRTGIRERRIAEPDQAASDLALPAARQALEDAGVAAEDLDLVVVATATPDMLFPATAAIVADELGAKRAAAYDLLAGCTGFVYALSQAYGAIATGLSKQALVVGTEALSKITNWQDRSTCILFGDGAGAAVVEPVAEGGILGFELGADGSGGPDLCIPAGGSRTPVTADALEQELQFIRMRGQEVFRFATRVMVTSAEELLAECGAGVEDVDLYVPHQANKRIIDHAVKNLGLASERVFMNIDRYGNTSSASIPLCLAEARDQGLLEDGTRVLMSAVGAGLTWGSAYMTWTNGRPER